MKIVNKCKLITEGKSESVCGRDDCCNFCDTKCDKKCDKDSKTCGYLSNTNETTDGAAINPTVNEFVSKYDKTLQEIRNFECEIAKIKEQNDILREKLLKAMEDFNIKSFENDYIKLTYIAPTTRESIDSKSLKANEPEIAKKYLKVSNIKASIKISVK